MTPIEDLGSIFTLEEIRSVMGEGFEIVCLDSTITPEGYRVKHFPYDSRFIDLPYDYYVGTKHVSEIKEHFVKTLEWELKKVNFKKGIIYFAPANRFSTIGKEAQLGYIFKTGDEVESEMNFIIKGEI